MKKFCLFSLLAGLLAALPVTGNAQANKEAPKLTREGAEALKNKDYDRAVDLFRRAAELDRKNIGSLSAALQQRAVALTGQQQYQKAIEDFSAALDVTPDDPGIYERRAYVEMKLGDFDRAIVDYNELIKRKPNEARYYLVRSYIYETKGNANDAVADCDKVLQLQHNNAEAKARKQRLQPQSAASPTPAGPIAAPSERPAPPKKP